MIVIVSGGFGTLLTKHSKYRTHKIKRFQAIHTCIFQNISPSACDQSGQWFGIEARISETQAAVHANWQVDEQKQT